MIRRQARHGGPASGARTGLAVLLALGTLVAWPRAHAADDSSDPHAHHHHTMPSSTTRTLVDYKLPDVALVRDDGKPVKLADEIDDGRAVVLSFIYTTCTAICPVTSATIAQLQDKLGSDNAKVHLVSISIDPEQDTPQRLAAYAKRYQAGPNWNHYTGSVEASVAVQRAFGAYRGDKMNHTPVTYVRHAPGQPWTRVDGFASADELLAEYKETAGGNLAAASAH